MRSIILVFLHPSLVWLDLRRRASLVTFTTSRSASQLDASPDIAGRSLRRASRLYPRDALLQKCTTSLPRLIISILSEYAQLPSYLSPRTTDSVERCLDCSRCPYYRAWLPNPPAYVGGWRGLPIVASSSASSGCSRPQSTTAGERRSASVFLARMAGLSTSPSPYNYSAWRQPQAEPLRETPVSLAALPRHFTRSSAAPKDDGQPPHAS